MPETAGASGPRGGGRALGHELVHGLRRGAPAFGLGVLLLLLAIPAAEDLDQLCRTLGIVLLVLGCVVVAATIGFRPRRD